MKESPLFKIKNLSCRYNDKKVVLKLDALEIPRGELIFVLGKSGIGKSTFIETLGLMNKTIHQEDDSDVLFYPEQYSAKTIKLAEMWHQSDQEISKFRNKYFSFVFQNTNLMPNFTSGENMCISQLIQGISFEEAKANVLENMEALDLSPDVFDKEISQLSGGQRQRLAFVRAVIASFEVLFGDEPTGNLDKDTAYKLMGNFKTQLQKQNRTGILVSHDIDLALNFADRIILLTMNKENNYGEVLKENIFTRNKLDDWNMEGTHFGNPKEKIIESLGLEIQMV